MYWTSIHSLSRRMTSCAENWVPSGTVSVLSAAEAMVHPADGLIPVVMYWLSVTSIRSDPMTSVLPASIRPLAVTWTVVWLAELTAALSVAACSVWSQ
jgi:hypothetical protein